MYALTYAAVLLPLFGALASFLAESARRVAQTCVVFTFFGLVAAVFLLVWRIRHGGDGPYDSIYAFWTFDPSGGVGQTFNAPGLTSFAPTVGAHVDQFGLVMLVVVLAIAFVTLWHSLEAIRGDAEYRRLFWTGSVLTSAVAGVVVSPSLFETLVMWGVASAFSWMMSTHWWHTEAAPSAARRRLVLARVGEACLLLAAVVFFVKFGAVILAQSNPSSATPSDPWSFSGLGSAVSLATRGGIPGVGTRTLVVVGTLVLVAVAGRLGLVPFDLALTDAEDSPLPALVFNITLLPLCGVVLIARTMPLLLAAPHLLAAFAVAGALTAAAGGVFALAQRDMGRIVVTTALAQWGMVAAAFGMGGYSVPLAMTGVVATMAVVVTFADSNMVRAYRTRNIAEMGGARTRLPLSSAVLALWVAGVAGADLVSYQALSTIFRNTGPGGGHENAALVAVVSIAVVVAAIALPAAALRTWAMVTAGEPVKRRGFDVARITDVPRTLRTTAVIALLVAVVAVVLSLPPVSPTAPAFSHFVFYGTVHQAIAPDAMAAAAAGACAVVGLGGGYVMRRRLFPGAAIVAGWRRAVPAITAVVAGTLGIGAVRVDEEFIAPLESALGSGMETFSAAAERTRVRYIGSYVAGVVVVIIVVVGLLAGFVTGHLRVGA